MSEEELKDRTLRERSKGKRRTKCLCVTTASYSLSIFRTSLTLLSSLFMQELKAEKLHPSNSLDRNASFRFCS